MTNPSLDDVFDEVADSEEDETRSKSQQARKSLEKRRLIDDLLTQKRLDKLLSDFADDY